MHSSCRYYPLYLLAQLVFAPMFIYADNFYNGPLATAWHALITFSLTQVLCAPCQRILTCVPSADFVREPLR